MFEKGQKVYQWNGGVQEWTYVRKNGLEHILIDANGKYGYFVKLKHTFFKTSKQAEINYLKDELKNFNEEIAEWDGVIEASKYDINNAEKQIKNCNKKLGVLHKKYEHLKEKSPEEFI